LAWVYAFGSEYEVQVLSASAAQIAAWGPLYGARCGSSSSSGSKVVNGTTANVPTGQSVGVRLGGTSAGVTNNAFTLYGVADGALDLFAMGASCPSSSCQAANIILRRGVNAATGSTLPVLDFAGAEMFTAETHAFSVAGGGTDNIYVDSDFLTTGGLAVYLG